MGGKAGRNFASERQDEGKSVFQGVAQHIKNLHGKHRRVAVAAWSNGARERLAHLMEENGVEDIAKVETWAEALKLKKTTVAFVVLGMEHGVETSDFAIIAEQDILGDRLVRPRRKSKKASDVLTEASALGPGDHVVHVEHGIGKFIGLSTIHAIGAPHDCLEVHYHGGDKLFLPVENIELLSRYGSDSDSVQLDRLGSAAWQSRKARMKARILEMAEQLIRVAALRMTRTAEPPACTKNLRRASLTTKPRIRRPALMP
jgi:transcription-repair coupling factor (superfamily II helicase)